MIYIFANCLTYNFSIMKLNNNEFCGDNINFCFRKRIIGIIQTLFPRIILYRGSHKPGLHYPISIDERYEYMASNVNLPTPPTIKKEGYINGSVSGSINDSLLKDGNDIIAGLDLPVWLGNPTEDKVIKIMIISQDPRRSLAEMAGHYPCIALSSPFGLHDLDWRSKLKEGLLPRVCKKIKDELEEKENKKICFYFTDFYKFRKANTYPKGSKDKVDKNNKVEYLKILKKEIDEYKPSIILLMGAEVANVLLGAKIYNKTIISGSPRKMNSLGDYFNPYYTHSSKHINSNIRVIPILHTSGNDHGQKKLAVDYLKGNGVLLQEDNVEEMFYKLIKNLIK